MVNTSPDVNDGFKKYEQIIDEVSNMDKMKVTSKVKLSIEIIEIMKHYGERLKN